MKFYDNLPNIEGLIKKINNMPDNKERYRLFHTIHNTLLFYVEAKVLTNDEKNEILDKLIDCEKQNSIHSNNYNKIVIDTYYNTNMINSLYKPVLTKANNYPFYFQIYNNIDIDKLLVLAEEFLYMIDKNLYGLYKKMIKDNLINEIFNYNYGGSCTYINGDNSEIILNHNPNNIYMIFALIHEMGHAYDNYLNKTQDYKRDNQINTEVTSLTFELLFAYFLLENNIKEKEEIKKRYRNYIQVYLALMNNAYIYNKLYFDKNVLMHEKVLNELTSEIIDSISLLQNNFSHKYSEELDFYNNRYGIGLLFSCAFLERFKRDMRSTIQEIKDLSCISNNLNTKEILSYFNKTELINATNKNILKVLKKRY